MFFPARGLGHLRGMCAPRWQEVLTGGCVHAQLWRGIAQHVAEVDPEVMVLVHPIPLDEEDRAEASIHRASQDSRASSNVLSGIASQTASAREHHLRLQACAQLVQTGMAQTELAGRVGNCCDGHVTSQVTLVGPLPSVLASVSVSAMGARFPVAPSLPPRGSRSFVQ